MLKIANAKVDVTPDDRGWIFFSRPSDPQPARDPLFARLFLLEDEGKSLLLISIDYGSISLSALDIWKSELAEILKTSPENIIIHALHQHDAPFINMEAAEIISPGEDMSWFGKIKETVNASAAKLTSSLREVAQIGWSETRVSGYASNRLVKMPDGLIHPRFSRCFEPELRDQPVGVIDPMLRTLGFFAPDGELLFAWSFYSTHPQVANEGKRYSADAPGEALRLLEERYPKVGNALFNGFFGNLSAGKYTSPTDVEGNITKFGKIIADAVDLNLQAMEKFPANGFTHTRKTFDYPLRRFTAEEIASRSEHKFTPPVLKASQEYNDKHGCGYAVDLIETGSVKLIFVDGELFVEYQLFAQSLIPDQKLAVVGNCGDNYLYIGTARAIEEKQGYEMQHCSRTLPEFEEIFKSTLAELLVK